jgi:transposase
MPKRNQLSVEQVSEIEEARKRNRDKRVEKRLKALLLHSEGKKRAEIARETEFAETYISELVSKYCNQGIGAMVDNKYGGNHRNMSYTEEEEFLQDYKQQAQQGQIIEVSAIKAAYEAKVGHTIGGSQIYYLLRRHGWRKLMPRSKHPNKASDEAIEASKKYTALSGRNWEILPPEKSG